MTLNLAQWSFKVIHFGDNRKPVYDFIEAVNSRLVTFAVARSIFSRFGDVAGFVRRDPFHTQLLFRLKFGVFPLEYKSVMLGSSERVKIGLISRETIFQELG